jgi:hypothetical protein
MLDAFETGSVQGAKVRDRLVQRPFRAAAPCGPVPAGLIQVGNEPSIDTMDVVQVIGQGLGVEERVDWPFLGSLDNWKIVTYHVVTCFDDLRAPLPARILRHG